MGDMREDRIYADRLGKTDLFVATGMGIAVVSVSNDRIGEFSLAHRCTARDVTTVDDGVAVATDEDVLVGSPEAPEPTGFGPAVAVTDGGAPVAAGPDGTVAQYTDGTWHDLGSVPEPRAVDGDLLAAADGVYRLPELDRVGLDDVTDVSTVGTPLASTAEGCYRLGPGWTRDLDGPFVFVTGVDSDRAHAGTSDRLYERREGVWTERDHPAAAPLVDAAYLDDGGVAALAESGRLLVDPAAAKDGHDGWRSRSLGLPGAVALAV